MHVNRERKALVKLGYACNNRCVFCHSAPLRGRVGASTQALEAKITAARVQGFEMVVLSGGEPTIHPGLGPLLRRVRREGLSLGFVTNGRRFAEERFVEGLRGFRLGYVYTSLHGARAATHDRLVGAPAFADSIRAIRRLSALPRLHLTVNTVVTRWNVDELEAIVDLLLDIGGLRAKLSYLEPKGDALANLDALLLSPQRAAARIREAIAHGEGRTADRGAELAWDALPWCLMPDREARYDDLRTNRIEVMSEADETAFFPVDHRNKTHAPRCADCARRTGCPGLYTAALERYGEGVLRPFSGE